jgi:hypothetical protein
MEVNWYEIYIVYYFSCNLLIRDLISTKNSALEISY